MPIEHPIDEQSKGAIENAHFAKLKALKFWGGLPTFSTTPTHTGIDGEIVLVDGTTKKICIYSEGWYCAGFRDIFTETYSSSTYPASTEVWEDWNISSLVPAGTTSVLVHLYHTEAAGKNLGIRKNGSSDNRWFYLPQYGNVVIQVEVGADRIIERYTANTSNTDSSFRIVGYFS